MKSCLYQFIFSLAQDNQRDLEQATEQLSEYLERDITSDILIDIKQKVQDKYRYCCHFTLQEKKTVIGIGILLFHLWQTR